MAGLRAHAIWRRNSPASADALARMDAEIDATAPTQMDRTLERMAALARGGEQPDAADLEVVMRVFGASGLTMTTDSGKFIGAWMGARVLARRAATEFAAL
jgi:hypothetical protein